MFPVYFVCVYLFSLLFECVCLCIICFYLPVFIVKETLNMTYKRTLLCKPDAILFALMLNKSVKGQNPPHASLEPLSILFCDVISDVIFLWVGGLLELLYYNYNAIYRILLHITQQIIERAI